MQTAVNEMKFNVYSIGTFQSWKSFIKMGRMSWSKPGRGAYAMCFQVFQRWSI